MSLKIKIFMWYVKRGVVLTKDNLFKHTCKGNKMCAFCSQLESIQHLFFDCHFAIVYGEQCKLLSILIHLLQWGINLIAGQIV
jgi:hypothetical protein